MDKDAIESLLAKAVEKISVAMDIIDDDDSAGAYTLEWKRDSDGTWYDAVKNKQVGWRLPTKYELEGLIDTAKYNPALKLEYDHLIIPKSGLVWSFDVYAKGGKRNKAWVVNVKQGHSTTVTKTSVCGVWYVRRV